MNQPVWLMSLVGSGYASKLRGCGRDRTGTGRPDRSFAVVWFYVGGQCAINTTFAVRVGDIEVTKRPSWRPAVGLVVGLVGEYVVVWKVVWDGAKGLEKTHGITSMVVGAYGFCWCTVDDGGLWFVFKFGRMGRGLVWDGLIGWFGVAAGTLLDTCICHRRCIGFTNYIGCFVLFTALGWLLKHWRCKCFCHRLVWATWKNTYAIRCKHAVFWDKFRWGSWRKFLWDFTVLMMSEYPSNCIKVYQW